MNKKNLLLQSQETKENTKNIKNTSLANRNDVNFVNVNTKRKNSFNTLSSSLSSSNEENLIKSNTNKNFLFKSNQDLDKFEIPYSKKPLFSSLNDIRMQEQSLNDLKTKAQSTVVSVSPPTPPPLPPPAPISTDSNIKLSSSVSINQKISKRINWEKIEDKHLSGKETIWQNLTSKRNSFEQIINQFNLNAAHKQPTTNQTKRCLYFCFNLIIIFRSN